MDIPYWCVMMFLLWDNYKYYAENEQLKHNQRNYIEMLTNKSEDINEKH
jgi:hypothetical protein